MKRPALRKAGVAGLLVAAAVGAFSVARVATGSDHQDTPEVELSPRLDIDDVYMFPGASEDRVVMVMTTSSPLTPAQTGAARFDPNALYQFKIDNTGDAVEDLVIQFVFDDQTGGGQAVNVIGPVRPAAVGANNRMAQAQATLSGQFNTNFGTATGMQVFAGPRDDPFYIDLEQFFKIIPDRRPSRGPLSLITKSANAFRGGPTPPFEAGAAVDFLRGFNTLAIVVELPEAQVRSTTGNNIGIWATISR